MINTGNHPERKMKKRTYENWINALALLFFLEGLLLGALVLLFSFALSTIASVGWGRWNALVWALFAFMMIFVLLRLVAAYGLWKRRQWVRTFGTVVGIIGILSFPIGTIIGGLSIWLLLVENRAETYFKLPDQ